MASNLPSSKRVKNFTSTLNSTFEIKGAPNGVIGVQQSLRSRLIFHVSQLAKQYEAAGKSLPSTLRVKLTGGTQIARGFTVVNFAFALLDDKEVCSAKGNHTLAILKVSESYDNLAAAIIEEAKDLEILTVDNKVYQVQYFLGGDWKFLALVCGIESASSNHACIWCKCPKVKR